MASNSTVFDQAGAAGSHTQPAWADLAKSLNLASPEEAARKAFEIASYVAEVEKSKSQKLLLKDGGKLFELKLRNRVKVTP